MPTTYKANTAAHLIGSLLNSYHLPLTESGTDYASFRLPTRSGALSVLNHSMAIRCYCARYYKFRCYGSGW